MPYKNYEDRLAWQRRFYAQHKTRIQAKHREYRRDNRGKYLASARRSELKKTRGKIENIQYPIPANCEACGILLASTAKGACLDHCHLTGMFRGWLCHKCNSALGLAGDTPQAVRKLLAYIEQAYDAIHKRILE